MASFGFAVDKCVKGIEEDDIADEECVPSIDESDVGIGASVMWFGERRKGFQQCVFRFEQRCDPMDRSAFAVHESGVGFDEGVFPRCICVATFDESAFREGKSGLAESRSDSPLEERSVTRYTRASSSEEGDFCSEESVAGKTTRRFPQIPHRFPQTPRRFRQTPRRFRQTRSSSRLERCRSRLEPGAASTKYGREAQTTSVSTCSPHTLRSTSAISPTVASAFTASRRKGSTLSLPAAACVTFSSAAA
jgi:hypothetical protein